MVSKRRRGRRQKVELYHRQSSVTGLKVNPFNRSNFLVLLSSEASASSPADQD